MKLQHKLVGLGLLGVAVSSSALSLGRARGNVVLGQPLSLAVEVRVDQAEDATVQCFRVDVFHGDTVIDPSRVRLVMQAPPAGSQEAVLRIRSSAVVDEPVVAVVLNALCGQGGARRYDFLPEFPAELQSTPAPVSLAAPPAAAPAAAVPSSLAPRAEAVPAPAAVEPIRPPAARAAASADAAPRPAPAPARRATPAPAPAPVRAPAAARPPAPPPAKVARAAAPKAAPAPRAQDSAPVAGAPRLTLDAPPARQDGLRPSAEVASSVIDDAAQREAVAAIWRALRTTPEEIVRDKQRLQALEAQQAQLGQRAAQPSEAERELRMRLERAERRLDEAESGRVDILLVYGLLALLALFAGLAAYFWQRARNAALVAAGHWTEEPRPSAGAPLEPAKADPAFTFRPAAVAKVSLAEEFRDSEPASALDAARPSSVNTDAVAAAVFAHDRSAPVDASRPVRPDEYFDVQQHADFFVSLGQYEQAIEVLRQHLHEHEDMSPLAFLDLFGIYHQLGRKDDFSALRPRFEQRFNAHVPSFAAFNDEGLGLEDYPATMLSIETAWGHARVLDTIEANLLRHPGDTGRPLDLAAYRDLLVLYGVAQDVFAAGDGASASALARDLGRAAPASPRAHAPAPLPAPVAAPVAAAGLLATDSMLDLVPDSAHAGLPSLDDLPALDLDIDLSTTPAQVAAPAGLSLVEVDIDLPLLDDEPVVGDAVPVAAPAPAAADKPELDSGLIDFDLFDPNTEARIAPKSTR